MITFLKSKMGIANTVEWAKGRGIISLLGGWGRGPGTASLVEEWGKGLGTVILVEEWERGAGSGASVGDLASKPI